MISQAPDLTCFGLGGKEGETTAREGNREEGMGMGGSREGRGVRKLASAHLNLKSWPNVRVFTILLFEGDSARFYSRNLSRGH